MHLSDLKYTGKQSHISTHQDDFTIILEEHTAGSNSVWQETRLPSNPAFGSLEDENIPERIRGMMALYDFGDGSFRQKCQNFYVQGKYMEDYEDDAPWDGRFQRYFTTYHDLRSEQLRGYFTWRTRLRQGCFEPIIPSLAYMYLYELLNGIGTTSPEDTLQKMQAFETGFLDAGYAGIGEEHMRENLHRWMLEYAILNHLPQEITRQYADADKLKTDAALIVLRSPGEHSDEDLYEALNFLGGQKTDRSIVIQKHETEGKHLFAAVWKYALAHYKVNRKDLFTACFGKQATYAWHPLENAVYWNGHPSEDADYPLTGCRLYLCRGGKWKVFCYQKLQFQKSLFEGLLHETDRRLRLYFNTGRPLKENIDNAWAASFIEAVLEADRQEKYEASRPKITIHFDDLDRIRQDAVLTRDSLLTEEEKAEYDISPQTASEVLSDKPTSDSSTSDLPTSVPSFSVPMPGVVLSDRQIQILGMLLQGASVRETIRSHHEMAEMIADDLNEALFDEIGDSIVECDGEELFLIEDYRDDLIQILGGN